jgi:hypothetical protein
MFKPSELPAYTVIQDSERGLFIKNDTKQHGPVWFDLHPHCVDCAKGISDSGVEIEEAGRWMATVTEVEKSDDYFKNFTVISVPLNISEDLRDQISKAQEGLI